MTVYLDTSSLVKLYIDEAGSEEVRVLVRGADAIATSAIAYAEAHATFARRRRERLLSPANSKDVVESFDLDWPRLAVVSLTDELTQAAGRLADTHDVRGCDAIHLASFEWLLARSSDDDVHFSCADERLMRAAATLG